MSTVLLDTHVLHWWSAEPDRVSRSAAAVLDDADESRSPRSRGFELAWLARHERIVVTTPLRRWLGELADRVRTANVTPGDRGDGRRAASRLSQMTRPIG